MLSSRVGMPLALTGQPNLPHRLTPHPPERGMDPAEILEYQRRAPLLWPLRRPSKYEQRTRGAASGETGETSTPRPKMEVSTRLRPPMPGERFPFRCRNPQLARPSGSRSTASPKPRPRQQSQMPPAAQRRWQLREHLGHGAANRAHRPHGLRSTSSSRKRSMIMGGSMVMAGQW